MATWILWGCMGDGWKCYRETYIGHGHKKLPSKCCFLIMWWLITEYMLQKCSLFQLIWYSKSKNYICYWVWNGWSCVGLRLKKINHMSQSCRAHLFFGARLIQQNPRFEFFCLFFFSVFYELSCQNIQVKIWQTQWNTLNNRLLQLCVLSCILLIQKSSSIFQSCDRLKSDTSAAQEKKKKKKKRLKKLRLGQVFQFVTSFET